MSSLRRAHAANRQPRSRLPESSATPPCERLPLSGSDGSLSQALGRVSEKGQVRRGGETEREEALWRLRNSRSEESRGLTLPSEPQCGRESPRATSRRASATCSPAEPGP